MAGGDKKKTDVTIKIGKRSKSKSKTKPKTKAKTSGRKKPSGKKPKTKVKVDLAQEFRETMSSGGVAEIVSLDSEDCLANVPLHFSTGSLALDRLLNGKGIPSGRVTEFTGDPHIGKSTLLDHVFASCQKMGGEAVLIEPEGARERGYTQRLGVDPKKLHYTQFGDREDMNLENVIRVIYDSVDFWRERAPDTPVVIGFDALGGTATREEMQNRLKESNQPGVAAKVMREASRQLPARLGNTKIAVVVCNHQYQSFKRTGFVGTSKESYGGGGLRYLTTIRLSLYPQGYIENSAKDKIGRLVGAQLLKNRLSDNVWASTKFALMSGSGINNVWTIFQELWAAKLMTVATNGWAALNLDGEILKFHGWVGLQNKCMENPELFPKLVSVYQGLINAKL